VHIDASGKQHEGSTVAVDALAGLRKMDADRDARLGAGRQIDRRVPELQDRDQRSHRQE
jgi:hypothetical protein